MPREVRESISSMSSLDLEMGGVPPEFDEDYEDEDQEKIPMWVIGAAIVFIALFGCFWYFYLIKEAPATVVAARAAKTMTPVTAEQPAEQDATTAEDPKEPEGSQSKDQEGTQEGQSGDGGLLDTIKENPLQTAGAAVLGVAGLYGTYKLGSHLLGKKKTGPLGEIGDNVTQWTGNKICGKGKFQLSSKTCKKVRNVTGKAYDITNKGTKHARNYIATFYNAIGWILGKPFTLINALIAGTDKDICTPENEKHLGWAALFASSFALENPYQKLNGAFVKFLRINKEKDPFWKYYPLKLVEYTAKVVTFPLWVIGFISSPTKSFMGKVAKAALPEEEEKKEYVKYSNFKVQAKKLRAKGWPAQDPGTGTKEDLEKSIVELVLAIAIKRGVVELLKNKAGVYCIVIPEDLKTYEANDDDTPPKEPTQPDAPSPSKSSDTNPKKGTSTTPPADPVQSNGSGRPTARSKNGRTRRKNAAGGTRVRSNRGKKPEGAQPGDKKAK